MPGPVAQAAKGPEDEGQGENHAVHSVNGTRLETFLPPTVGSSISAGR